MRTDNKANDKNTIDLMEILGVLLHYAWIIIISAVVMTAAGFAVSKFVMTPMYTSDTGIYIMSKQNDQSSVTYSDTQLASQLTKDYEELITCRTVLENVIEECELNDSYRGLKSRVSVSNKANTRIITIAVTDASPEKAQTIANCIRETAAKHITNVTDIEAVTVVDEANLPTSPSEPSVKKYTLLAAMVGLVLSAGVIIIRFMLDDTIKTAEDVENYLGLSALALIPVMEVIDDQGNKAGKKSGKKTASEHGNKPVKSAPSRPAQTTSERYEEDAPVRTAQGATSQGASARPVQGATAQGASTRPVQGVTAQGASTRPAQASPVRVAQGSLRPSQDGQRPAPVRKVQRVKEVELEEITIEDLD